jgi:hypothetical protein
VFFKSSDTLTVYLQQAWQAGLCLNSSFLRWLPAIKEAVTDTWVNMKKILFAAS